MKIQLSKRDHMIGFPSVLESIDDLTTGHIDQVLQRAMDLKSGSVARLPLEKSLAVATSFLEHSTRTKHSFAMAIKRLQGFHIDFHAESSSLKKGESIEQTLLTLHYQGVDICIIRTKTSHLLNEFKESPPIKIINGGDGSNQHPTQALLDLFTIKQTFETLKGKTIAIIGDCIHSRVTHSLTDLLPKYGIKLILCGPAEFLPQKEMSNVEYSSDLDETIMKSDALYLLRIQSERHSSALEVNNYHQQWGVSLDRLKKLKKELPIFHPGPANIGIEVCERLVNSHLWMAHQQVHNSVYVRMAIIEAMVNNNDKHIGAIYNNVSGEISAGQTNV